MNRYISPSTRFRLLRAAGFRCRYCGRAAPTVILEIDHVHPKSAGGSNDESNLVVACFDCNRGKRDQIISLQPIEPVLDLTEPLDALRAVRDVWPDNWMPLALISINKDTQNITDCCPDCADYQLAIRPVVVLRMKDGYEARYRCPEGHTWSTYLAFDVVDCGGFSEPEADMPYWPKVGQ